MPRGCPLALSGEKAVALTEGVALAAGQRGLTGDMQGRKQPKCRRSADAGAREEPKEATGSALRAGVRRGAVRHPPEQGIPAGGRPPSAGGSTLRCPGSGLPGKASDREC